MSEVYLPPITFRKREARELCLKKNTTASEIVQQKLSHKRLSLKRKQTPSSDQKDSFSKPCGIVSQTTPSLKNLLAQTSRKSKMHTSPVTNTALSAPLKEIANTTPSVHLKYPRVPLNLLNQNLSPLSLLLEALSLPVQPLNFAHKVLSRYC